jgi:hypothetical protein
MANIHICQSWNKSILNNAPSMDLVIFNDDKWSLIFCVFE